MKRGVPGRRWVRILTIHRRALPLHPHVLHRLGYWGWVGCRSLVCSDRRFGALLQQWRGLSVFLVRFQIFYAAAKSLQSCPTLCDPIDGSPPGSPVPGILQTTTLQWVAISFSSAWKWKVKVKSLSYADSSRPHGLQPTRLLRPWDFPGKSTGVGCHCLLLFVASLGQIC